MSAKKPWYRRIPWWGWAGIVVVLGVGAISNITNPPAAVTAPTLSIATPSTPPAAAPASPSPTAEPPKTEAISTGLTDLYARSACDAYGEHEFPYGWKGHTIAGLLAARIENDQWFIKFEADVKNEFNAKRSVDVECRVMGTDSQPTVTSFTTY